jgi:hypothetical protein
VAARFAAPGVLRPRNNQITADIRKTKKSTELRSGRVSSIPIFTALY